MGDKEGNGMLALRARDGAYPIIPPFACSNPPPALQGRELIHPASLSSLWQSIWRHLAGDWRLAVV